MRLAAIRRRLENLERARGSEIAVLDVSAPDAEERRAAAHERGVVLILVDRGVESPSPGTAA